MHFYENTAGGVIPRHFVPMTSRPGELRPTRMADAKKNRWVASVTTIQGMLDKSGLNNWRIDEHLKQAYKFLDYSGTHYELEGWIEAVKKATQSELDKAPQQGTDIHDTLEHFILGDLSDSHEYFKLCANVLEVMRGETGVDAHVWEPERAFVDSIGFAGKVDVNYSLSDNKWVCDFKSKNTADKWKPGKMHYPEMCMQLAAYRVGLGLPNARCANVFVCLEDGAVEFHEWPEDDLNREWANFADLLRIWLRNAGYTPKVTA